MDSSVFVLKHLAPDVAADIIAVYLEKVSEGGVEHVVVSPSKKMAVVLLKDPLAEHHMVEHAELAKQKPLQGTSLIMETGPISDRTSVASCVWVSDLPPGLTKDHLELHLEDKQQDEDWEVKVCLSSDGTEALAVLSSETDARAIEQQHHELCGKHVLVSRIVPPLGCNESSEKETAVTLEPGIKSEPIDTSLEEGNTHDCNYTGADQDLELSTIRQPKVIDHRKKSLITLKDPLSTNELDESKSMPPSSGKSMSSTEPDVSEMRTQIPKPRKSLSAAELDEVSSNVNTSPTRVVEFEIIDHRLNEPYSSKGAGQGRPPPQYPEMPWVDTSDTDVIGEKERETDATLDPSDPRHREDAIKAAMQHATRKTPGAQWPGPSKRQQELYGKTRCSEDPPPYSTQDCRFDDGTHYRPRSNSLENIRPPQRGRGSNRPYRPPRGGRGQARGFNDFRVGRFDDRKPHEQPMSNDSQRYHRQGYPHRGMHRGRPTNRNDDGNADFGYNNGRGRPRSKSQGRYYNRDCHPRGNRGGRYDGPPPGPYEDTYSQLPNRSPQQPVQTMDVPLGNLEKARLVQVSVKQGTLVIHNCDVKVDLQSKKAVLSGHPDILTGGKLYMLESLQCIDEHKLDASSEFASKLLTKQGEDFLESKQFHGVIALKDSCPYVLSLDNGDRTPAGEQLKHLVDARQSDYRQCHLTYLNSETWKTTKAEAESKQLVVINVKGIGRDNKGVITVEGVKSAVFDVTCLVRKLLKENATEKESIRLKKGVARLFDIHGSSLLSDIKEKTKVQVLKLETRSSTIFISGLEAEVSEAKTAVDKLLKSVQYGRYSEDRHGVKVLLSDILFETLLHGFERRNECVVEPRVSGTIPLLVQPAAVKQPEKGQTYRKSGDDQSRQHSPRSRDDSPPVAPRSDVTEVYRKSGVVLYIKQGDITKCKAGVLINTVGGKNVDLANGGTVAKAFLKVGGSALQEAVNKEVADFQRKKANGEVSGHQKVIITNSCGNLSCNRVFHIKVHHWKGRDTEDDLAQTLQDCFYRASVHQESSIAVAMIGSGILRYPQDRVAVCFQKAADKAASHGSNIKVYIVAYDDRTYRDSIKTFSDLTQGQRRRDPDNATSAGTVYRPTARGAPTTVVFHINAFESQHIDVIKKQLKSLLDRHIMTESIKMDEVMASDTKQLNEIEKLNSDSLRVTIDLKTKHIHLMGLEREVMQARVNIDRYLRPSGSQSRQNVSGPKAFLLQMAEEKTKVPRHWTEFRGHITDIIKQFMGRGSALVDADAKTSQAVEKLLQKSWRGDVVGHGRDAANLNHKAVRVKSVQRIENPQVWMDYDNSRKRLMFTAIWSDIKPVCSCDKKDVLTSTFNIAELDHLLVPEVNEVFLFHGTSEENIKSIQQQGLDFRLGNMSGMFGKGIYFAESSTKADQYADDRVARASGKDLYMFVVRVLLGKVYVCQQPQQFQRPPCTKCQTQDCKEHKDFYDSVLGVGRGGGHPLLGQYMGAAAAGSPLLFREFIVYEKDRCYPEFIVKYQRN